MTSPTPRTREELDAALRLVEERVGRHEERLDRIRDQVRDRRTPLQERLARFEERLDRVDPPAGNAPAVTP